MSDKKEEQLKTCDQLEYEWGDSTDSRSCKKYIYDYMNQELASLREQLERYKNAVLIKDNKLKDVQDDFTKQGAELFSLQINYNSLCKVLKKKEDENRELLKTIEYGELELRTTYERHTNYKGSSSLWKMQEILKKYGGKNLSA